MGRSDQRALRCKHATSVLRPSSSMAQLLDSPFAPKLDTLPPWALALVLASPQLALSDLGRVACVSKKLCVAALNAALPQWASVRVIGTALKLDADVFKARAGRMSAQCSAAFASRRC